MNVQEILFERRVAAILLILCGLVFVPAGILYTARAIWKWPAAQSDLHFMWERGLVMAAALLNALGFVLLEEVIQSTGNSIVAWPALAAYLIGTAVLLAAEGSFLYNHEYIYPQVVVYVVLAFLAQAAFGVSLLRSGIVAGWVGWATIIWNLAWLVILPIVSPRDIYFPVLHHVAPLMIGVVLLAAR